MREKKKKKEGKGFKEGIGEGKGKGSEIMGRIWGGKWRLREKRYG